MADKIIGVFVLLVMVTGLAVIVSKRSDTAKVATAFLNGFSNNLKAAASPIR